MNLYVATQLSIPALKRCIPNWEILRDSFPGVYADNSYPPDAIISMGIGAMEETWRVIEKYPRTPLFCYNWDTYEWVWTRPRRGEYNYHRYGELLARATEIWVPSRCTGLRTQQWWGLKNWHVILSSVPYWDHDDVKDEGYVYCSLREIPDSLWDTLKPACREAGIPLEMSRHELGYPEYQKMLAHCRFMVSHCYELSTGGLSLLEGYYLGKPCLLCDSPWHGGRDYFGGRARYFQWQSVRDLKDQLLLMYREPQLYVEADHKEYVSSRFSDHRMIEDMLGRIQWYRSTRLSKTT